jgi:hypothetical protein
MESNRASKRRSTDASWKKRNVPVVSTLGRRDEGEGGADGIVLDLTMVGDGLFNAYVAHCSKVDVDVKLLMWRHPSIYTVPVQVGTNNDVFYLQVDTGSSDFVSILCRARAKIHSADEMKL